MRPPLMSCDLQLRDTAVRGDAVVWGVDKGLWGAYLGGPRAAGVVGGAGVAPGGWRLGFLALSIGWGGFCRTGCARRVDGGGEAGL